MAFLKFIYYTGPLSAMKSIIRGRRSLLSTAATNTLIILLLAVVAVLSLPLSSSSTRTKRCCCAQPTTTRSIYPKQQLLIRHHSKNNNNAQLLILAAAPPTTSLYSKKLSKSEHTNTNNNNRGQQQQRRRQRRQKLSRRDRKKRLDELQQQRRRNRWMKRYGTVEALQQTFGTGPPWGDLSPTQTRSLYHTLLPRSLLALNEMGLVKVEDLAPLAYEARIAAKNYARSRCVWTGRVGVFLFDQYRSLRDKGRLVQPGTSSSMSWEEIWAKYESQIVQEQQEQGKEELDEDELMMQTYMRILEKSCSTNEAVDNLFLKDNDDDEDDIDGVDISLASIASQLEQDVRAILLSPSEITKAEKTRKKLERKQMKEREREEKMRRKADRKEERRKRKWRLR